MLLHRLGRVEGVIDDDSHLPPRGRSRIQVTTLPKHSQAHGICCVPGNVTISGFRVSPSGTGVGKLVKELLRELLRGTGDFLLTGTASLKRLRLDPYGKSRFRVGSIANVDRFQSKLIWDLPVNQKSLGYLIVDSATLPSDARVNAKTINSPPENTAPLELMVNRNQEPGKRRRIRAVKDGFNLGMLYHCDGILPAWRASR